jgi:NAD-dependent SIR2 family protein deacetylase
MLATKNKHKKEKQQQETMNADSDEECKADYSELNKDVSEPIAQLSSDVFEIAGNINYMRCSMSCLKEQIFPLPPKLFGGAPVCPLCGSLARLIYFKCLDRIFLRTLFPPILKRPNIRFFDEVETEEYLKADTAYVAANDLDCLILIGTSMEAPLTSKIVGEAINNNALIVEINSKPVLEFGNVKQLIGDAEDIAPILCRTVEERYRSYKDGFGYK